MANISWLVQSCCNPSVINYVEDSPILSEGVSFADSLGNCYTVVEQSEETPTILFTNRETYTDCLKCTDENPCPPPGEKPKKWLVQSCCDRGVTKIIADNTLLPGNIFQDINGNCYTVLTITSGAPNIVRGNLEVYRTCDICKPCASPSPTPTPSITESPFPTPSTTPSVTVTPSPTTYNFANSSPSPTPTVTKTVTPSVTPSINTPECKCITFTNTDASSSYNCFYTNCAGTTNTFFSLGPEDIAQVCGSDPSVQNPAVTFYTGSYCQGGQCVRPDTSPSPTPTPSITPVSGSFVSPDDLCMDVVFGPAPSVSATPSVTVSVTPSITVSPSPYPIYPSITPTSTPSITPSVTPSVTPSISVSTTPSTTPSVTPTKTVTPSLTPSKTPSVTVSPTKTPTPTPSPSRNSIVVSECAVIYISGTQTYSYNITTNVSTLLPIPITLSTDIAHTTNKLWVYNASLPPYNATGIYEYNITLSPFSSTYSRLIPLPVGIILGAGLCAIDDTTLISSNNNNNDQIIKITLHPSPDNTVTIENLFALPAGRRIAGDVLYTTDNKIILTTYTSPAPYYFYISQYALINEVWTLEFDLDITQTSPYSLGLATINGGIYMFSNTNLKQINTTFPYTVTQVNNIGRVVGGASQVPSCNNVSFQPNVIPASPSPTPTPTKTVTPSITVSPSITPSRTPSVTPSTSPPNNTPCNGNGTLPLPGNNITYSGITITASGTGVSTLYPSSYASCNTTTPAGTVILGNSGNFSYTLTFNQPVNNIKLPITRLAGQTTGEIFTFTTNGGTPTITSPNNCLSTISGNTIIGNSPLVGNGGGGLFTISAPSPFTTLTITGPGGLYGAIIGIDCTSIQPPPPTDCVSCNTIAMPQTGTGTITNGNLTINTTYSGPQLFLGPTSGPSFTTCTNISAPVPYVLLGYNPGAFIYTLTFNQPVNNIKFLIWGGGTGVNPTNNETFTFNTEGGVPILSTCGISCGTTINNNTLTLGYVSPEGGSALIQVKATNPYTQIIITGNGAADGSGFNLCLDTAIPVPSPSPTPTPTKTATPSKTPSVTVSPSKTASTTPSITVSPSKTPSVTPSPTPNSGCNTMLYRSQTGGYGSYNFTTNTPTTLNVAANPYPANDTVNNIPKVIANTSNKMWVYATGATTSEVNLRESDIVLSPFTSTFNRNIILPTGYKPANGLFALSNTTLVGTFTSYNGVNLTDIPVVELNITSNVATFTTKCTLPYQNKPVGGLIVTTGVNPKLIILTRFGANGAFFINQYDYTTGALEFKKIISPTVQVPSGLAEINGNIYIIGSNVYKIDTVAPYALTLIQTVIGSQIINTSQLASCIDTKLPTGSCDTCNIGILSQNNILTYNGVTIVPSYVGPPSAYANGIYTFVDSNCIDNNAFSIPAGSITLGQYASTATPAPFSYTLTFSQPVNNIKLAIGGMGGVTQTTQESFAFNTNGGIPTLTSCKGCFGSINGNTVTASLANSGVVSNGISAGGILTITSPSNYTTLTISGPGGVYGSTFAICTDSITPIPVSPSPSPTPSKTPTPTPTPSTSSNNNALGCVYYNSPLGGLRNYNVITNTSSAPITLPNLGAVFSQNDTHTSTKYFKSNNTNLIQEWIPTNNPTTLAFIRNISVNTGYTSFYYAFAIDDYTLLAVATNSSSGGQSGFINANLIRIDITNNTVTPSQVTSLFSLGAGFSQTSLGFGSMLLTSTNKILFVGTRLSNNTSISTIYQYSYPNGTLEGMIDLTPIVVGSGYGQYVKLFETGGNIFFSLNAQPTLTPTNIYQINLNSPYTITSVSSITGLNQGFNSSINCNTVNFNVSSPQPSPSPTPSTSPPPANFRTIYKYLDIQ
jgi:hypothetical protein